MSVTFKKQQVSKSVENKRSYGRGNPVDYVVIHQTGNTNKGANAQMHAKLQSNLNPRPASWHEQVDDTQAIQSFPDGAKCWAATDGRGPGNSRGYHIEICINSDGNYKKAVENGAKRAAAKLKQYGHGIDRLKQHADFYNKNCPAQIRAGKDGITWSVFINMVKGFMSGTNSVKPSKPKPNTSTPKANLTVDGYWGKATTKALQKALGTVSDGEIWGQYKTATTKQITGGMVYGPPYNGSPVIVQLQKKVGGKRDGLLGPDTVKRLQKHLNTPVDGEIWKPSTMVKEMQRRLNAGTF